MPSRAGERALSGVRDPEEWGAEKTWHTERKCVGKMLRTRRNKRNGVTRSAVTYHSPCKHFSNLLMLGCEECEEYGELQPCRQASKPHVSAFQSLLRESNVRSGRDEKYLTRLPRVSHVPMFFSFNSVASVHTESTRSSSVSCRCSDMATSVLASPAIIIIVIVKLRAQV